MSLMSSCGRPGGLRSIDSRFAVRDLEAVEAEARHRGFWLAEVVDMPANNLSLVFRRH